MTDRKADYPIDTMFLDRWSPRAYDGSDISDADLMTLFEAARWAPSAYNYQPWQFLYAKKGDANWDAFLSALIPFNQGWVANASVLMFVISDSLMVMGEKSNPNHSHSFDAGAAWAYLALQGSKLGLHAHGMTGVDFDKAREVLALPERYRVEAAVAVGRMGELSVLPEGLREREAPSPRKPVSEFVTAGPFKG